MSIELFDYSQLTNTDRLTIPEGEVAQISCNGSAIWYSADNFNGYQPVEYIQSDGNQYFDTGVNASNYPDGIKYVFRGCVTEYQTTSNIYWFGALANGCRSGNFFSMNTYVGFFCGGSGNNYFYKPAAKPGVGEDFELIAQGTPKSSNACTVTVNGIELTPNAALTDSAMPNANIYFLTAFGTGASNTADRKFCGKIYSFTMDSADGTPIRNFVPCYRKSDGVIGLYDTIEDKFYTNIGTGNFTKGNDCLSYYAYQPVEWICAEKDVSAYIDLGFSFDTAATIYIEQFLDNEPQWLTSGEQTYIFGAANSSGVYRCMFTSPENAHGSFVYGSDGTTYLSGRGKYIYAGKNRIKIVYKVGDVHWENLDTGEITVVNSGTTSANIAYTMTDNLYLLGQNYKGAARFNNTNGHSRKIGRFSYYDKDNNLICDLYPCYHKLYKTIGMYDKVRNIFLINIGTGDFTKGPDV